MERVRGVVVAVGLAGVMLLGACSDPEVAEPTETGTAAAPVETAVVPPPPAEGCRTDLPPFMAKPTFDEPFPAETTDPSKTYSATMTTSCGVMVIDLLMESAPQAVNNFVALSQEGWYDDTLFHRIANSIDIIQGGDGQCTGQLQTCGSGGPGYAIPDELSGSESYTPGTVAMANAGPNTGGSQFFIVTGPNAAPLPPNYVVFGQIAEGLEVAELIQSQPVQGETPQDMIWIESVTIAES